MLVKRVLKKKAKLTVSSKKFASLVSQGYKIATTDAEHNDPNAYPFLISTKVGFNPRQTPQVELPARFAPLDSLLKRMVWIQPDGSQGLMAKKQLVDAVKNELPVLEVDDIEDTMVQLTVYRDYSFLNNAYVLEPCHHNWEKTGKDYGLGRDFLPKNIAIPYTKISKKLGLKPYLEYNTGYGLNNWKLIDTKEGIKYENMDTIRLFIGNQSEKGFILTHCTINAYSGNLIKSGMEALKSAEMGNREDFNNALTDMKDTMVYMNVELNRMFMESKPSDYNTFRTFIMGITDQPMFPKGVVYEGCFNGKAQFYRGETGANDSIIPFCDNIIEVTASLPKNPLTDLLRDFRTYRPKSHQEFLSWLEDAATKIGMLEFAKKDSLSLLRILEVADQIRTFRHTHWVLTNLYILNTSPHPKATGGSPIVRYLPNQLLTVIRYIKENSKYVNTYTLNSADQFKFESVLGRAISDERIITKQADERGKVLNQ